MSSLLRSSRVLRLLLVGMFVPLIVVTSGGGARAVLAAAAAGATSEARTFNVEVPRDTDIRCAMVYGIGPGLGGGTFQVHSGGWCEQKAIPEWGEPPLGSDGASFSLTIRGQHADGAKTDWTLAWSIVSVEDGFFGNHIKMGTTSAPVSAGWQMHEICVNYNNSHGFDRSGSDCQPAGLALGNPTECDTMSIQSVTPTVSKVKRVANNTAWYITYEITYSALESVFLYRVQNSNTSMPGLGYGVPTGSTLFPNSHAWNMSLPTTGGETVTSTFDLVASRTQYWGYPDSQLDPFKNELEPLGLGFATATTGNVVAKLKVPPAHVDGIVGATDDSGPECLVWMGPKMWDNGQPGGPDEPNQEMPLVQPAPDEPVEVPAPETGDDNKWPSLFNMLRDLPKKLLDGLKGLFIPDEWPDFTGLSVDLPEGWVPEWPNVSGGACGPLNMPTITLGATVGDVEATPFVDTCAEPWPLVRTVIYYGLLGSVLVVVGNRIIRAAMAGLGMGVDSPAGGGDE